MSVVDAASVLPDVWADYPFTNSVPYPQWIIWRIGILREFVRTARATWPLTDKEREERRLAKYRRYRGSLKGWERMRRYNAGPTARGAQRRYRATLVRSEYSYQRDGGAYGGRWVHFRASEIEARRREDALSDHGARQRSLRGLAVHRVSEAGASDSRSANQGESFNRVFLADRFAAFQRHHP